MRSGSMSAGSTAPNLVRWVPFRPWSTSARGGARARWPWLDRRLRVHERFGEIGGGPLSSSIALATFLSLFPLLLVAIAVVGFLVLGQRRLHQRRHRRARAPGRGRRGGRGRHRHRRGQHADGDRSSGSSACSGPASAVVGAMLSRLQRRVAGRRAAACWTGPSRSPGSSRPGRCSWSPRRSARRCSWLPGVLVPVDHPRRASSSPPCCSAGPTRPSATTRSAGGSTSRARCWWRVGFEILKVVGTVYLPRADRRVLRALRLDRRGVRASSPGSRSTPASSSTARSLNVVRYEAGAGTVTVEIEVPRIEGEVPLTATRGGAVDERAESDRTRHRSRPIGPSWSVAAGLSGACRHPDAAHRPDGRCDH